MSRLREQLGRLRGLAAERPEVPLAEPAADERQPATEPTSEDGAADESVAHPDVAGDRGECKREPGFAEIGAYPESNQWGQFMLRRISYPFPFKHGRYALEELLGSAERLHPVAYRQNRGGEPFGPHQLLFLDTETTGLGVGTGNVPFMVGFGYYTEEAFIVEQALIRNPAEEKAMLAHLLERMRGRTHLVTYNGRTFDWPVLEGRFILNGWRRSGEEPGHLDFLHPSRALWRGSLPSCRLSSVEEARLGVVRRDDISGAEAPALYFSYLHEGDPRKLHGVYHHNELDILTLAALSVHFARLLGGGTQTAEAASTGSEELFRTVVWLERHGSDEVAAPLLAMLEQRTAEGVAAAGWAAALAARYKRAGEYAKALPLWERCAAAEEASALAKPEALVELAIYYEHRAKQPLTALNYAERALALARSRAGQLRETPGVRAERETLLRRVERLLGKARRVNGKGLGI